MLMPLRLSAWFLSSKTFYSFQYAGLSNQSPSEITLNKAITRIHLNIKKATSTTINTRPIVQNMGSNYKLSSTDCHPPLSKMLRYRLIKEPTENHSKDLDIGCSLLEYCRAHC